MKLHSRRRLVVDAQIALTTASLDLAERLGLTELELLQALQHVQSETMRSMLRSERHPTDPRRGADEE